MNNRYAFSLIELVFVIVILGVLAVIAIPKLAATRDDAKVSAMSRSISTAASEIAAYAISTGTIENQIGSMSNTVADLERKGEAQVHPDDPPYVDFKMGNVLDCLIFRIDDGIWDANLSLHYGDAGSDQLCNTLQTIFDASQYPIPLRGRKVKYDQ